MYCISLLFDLLKTVLFGPGLGWFATLLIGVFYLAFPKRKDLGTYFDLSFKLANIEITALLIFFSVYYLVIIFL